MVELGERRFPSTGSCGKQPQDYIPVAVATVDRGAKMQQSAKMKQIGSGFWREVSPYAVLHLSAIILFTV
jgi:hypothetical protein